jgi:hypothetical protein
MQKTYWQLIIKEIQEITAKRSGEGRKWSYEVIGEKVGSSRSGIWRLTLDKDHPDHIDEPKWSVGMALLEIHSKLKEKK